MAISSSDTTSGNTAADPQKASRQIPIVCPGHTRPLAELSFLHLPDEQKTLLVSACHDRMPMIRDGLTGDWIGTFSGHKGAVWSCRLDPQGYLAATASGDFSVHVWDAVTGAPLYQFAHGHICKACEFDASSRYLVTGGHEGLLRMYDLTLPKQEPASWKQEVDGKKVAITRLLWWTLDTVLTGGADGKIRAFSVHSVHSGASQEAPIHTIGTGSGKEIRDMEMCRLSTGETVLTVASGDHVYFYELQPDSVQTAPALKHAYKMPIHFREEGGASLHPDGEKFVAGGSDLWIRVFDYKTGQELECHKGHHGPIRCVRYNPTGTLYATGSEDGTIRLWKTNPEAETE